MFWFIQISDLVSENKSAFKEISTVFSFMSYKGTHTIKPMTTNSFKNSFRRIRFIHTLLMKRFPSLAFWVQFKMKDLFRYFQTSRKISVFRIPHKVLFIHRYFVIDLNTTIMYTKYRNVVYCHCFVSRHNKKIHRMESSFEGDFSFRNYFIELWIKSYCCENWIKHDLVWKMYELRKTQSLIYHQPPNSSKSNAAIT